MPGTFNEETIYGAHTMVSEHFSIGHFVSPGDTDAVKNGIPKEYIKNIEIVAERLEVIRKAIGDRDIVIRSGYRSHKYNRRIGGSKYSQHLYGKAVDIYVEGREMSCSDLANLIYFRDDLRPLFGGYGLGSDVNVHLDIRERKDPMKPVVWWYGKKSWKEWG